MTVITKATTDKKDQKALLLLSDKLPEVAVTKPHDQPQPPPTRRAEVKKQNENNPLATFLTLVICVGIITGMSIFTYKVYRQKWFQRRTSNGYRVEMHRADPSATWMGREFRRIDKVPQNEVSTEKDVHQITGEDMAQSLAKDRDIAQIPYIEWFRAYLIFNGQYMVLANDLEGGFKNINAMNKTSQALDSKTYTEVETHEVEAIVSTPYMTELIYEYTEDEQTLELFQMPQLSSGRYIHDFEKEKTLIFDSVNDRCFVMDLDKNEIKPPKTICDMYRGMHEADGDGVYKMDLEEVRQETYAREIAEITSQEYGCPIKTLCQGKKSYRLDDIPENILEEMTREKRSTDSIEKEPDFVEFGGKSLVKYSIVNINDL